MTNIYPKGTCEQMCPESEIIMREQEGLLHTLELDRSTKNKADKNKITKEFCRSAAGRICQKPEQLRTFNALLLTTHYLLHDVVVNKCLPWNVIYDYIMDRLRAVRQDLVIQNFDKADTISLLQPIIKFYAYSAYRLCEEPIEVFDPTINSKHLLECLKRLLCLYDSSDILLYKFNKCHEYQQHFKKNVLYSNVRPFMECLYLITNLGNTDAIERAIRLPDIWRTAMVKRCLRLSIDYLMGNYIRVCRQMRTLNGLLLSCATLHLPQLRKKCLHVMSIAYNSRNLPFPAAHLAQLLLYEDVTELLKECLYYELAVIDDSILFTRATFNSKKLELSPRHLRLVDRVMEDTDLPTLFLNDN